MADLLCMGEPMLEFNRQRPGPDGRVLFLEGHGGDASKAAIAAARSAASVGYVSAIGADYETIRQRLAPVHEIEHLTIEVR